MSKNKPLLPTYHQQSSSSLINGRRTSSSNVSYEEITWRSSKQKLQALTAILFLCSLWTVSHFSGTAFDIHSLSKYTDNAAAMAAASVMGEGGEEGIHGLEVEIHGLSGYSGHIHSVHDEKIYIYEFDDEELEDFTFDEEDSDETESMTPLEKEIDDIIHDHSVVIFSKTYCPYSRRAKHILAQYPIIPHPYVVEVDIRDDAEDVKMALFKFTYQATFPNIFVKGRSLGGSEELAILSTTGKLEELLIEAGAVKDTKTELYHR